MIKYEVWTEQPTLDFYRRDYCPREDYTLAGMWPGGIFTGASGKRYHGMRGFDELVRDNAHTYTFMELNEQNLNDNSPHLYPDELPFDQFEPFEYSETDDAVHYVGENVRVEVRVGSFDWYDAKGRYEIHVQQVGQACTFWVPEQEGIPVPIQHRSEIGKATGQINGDPVEGFTFLDSSYSHPGVMYFYLPLIQKLEKQWSMWLVEYNDGEMDAGFAWKGRGQTGFSAAHLIVNGVSTALSDSRTFTEYTRRGTAYKARVELGDQVVELEQDTVSDWPTHTFGKVVSTSRGKEIAKGWNYIEWMPDNTEKLLEGYLSGQIEVHHAQEAWIEDESLFFPDHIFKSG
jgi:hypothetical protein